jgi:hypothetical protein
MNSIRIFTNRWFAKFAQREQIEDAALCEAIARATAGLVDADLGGGLLKQRVARAGQGRSGGFRTIIIFRSGDRAIFVFGFAKKDRANLNKVELKAYQALAKVLLGMTPAQFDGEIAAGELMEVNGEKDLQE